MATRLSSSLKALKLSTSRRRSSSSFNDESIVDEMSQMNGRLMRGNNKMENILPSTTSRINAHYSPAALDDRPAVAMLSSASNRGGYGLSTELGEGEEVPSGNIALHKCIQCGRTFNVQALQRHSKVCKKVFATTRHRYNSRSKRLAELKSDPALQQSMQTKSPPQRKTKNNRHSSLSAAETRPLPQSKVPKWEMQVGRRGRRRRRRRRSPLCFHRANNLDPQQSGQLRAAIASTKAASATSSTNTREAGRSEAAPRLDFDDRVPCTYCGRRFSVEAAERHIPFCQSQHKKKMISSSTSKKKATMNHPPARHRAPSLTKSGRTPLVTQNKGIR